MPVQSDAAVYFLPSSWSPFRFEVSNFPGQHGGGGNLRKRPQRHQQIPLQKDTAPSHPNTAPLHPDPTPKQPHTLIGWQKWPNCPNTYRLTDYQGLAHSNDSFEVFNITISRWGEDNGVETATCPLFEPGTSISDETPRLNKEFRWCCAILAAKWLIDFLSAQLIWLKKLKILLLFIFHLRQHLSPIGTRCPISDASYLDWQKNRWVFDRKTDHR